MFIEFINNHINSSIANLRKYSNGVFNLKLDNILSDDPQDSILGFSINAILGLIFLCLVFVIGASLYIISEVIKFIDNINHILCEQYTIDDTGDVVYLS